MDLLKQVFLAMLLLLTLGAQVASAEAERIVNYHSDITVDSDTTLVVEETITVYVAGIKIKRGIFRDFPTHTTDDLGQPKVAGFELLEVRRGGKQEPYHLEYYDKGVRIYIGDEDYFLPAGKYTYTIKYKTYRQLEFFPSHDELYWNVTGSFWDFGIEQASADVHLPARFGEDSLEIGAFTGMFGSTDTDYSAFISDRGDIHFESARALRPREGLTIVVKFPKGKLQPPTAAQIKEWWLIDHRVEIAAYSSLALMFCYFFVVWLAVGVDPKPGGIQPLGEPPEGLSPAALRYIRLLKSDHKTFIAVILSMGAKGWLKVVEDDPGKFRVHRTGEGATPLAREEEVVYAKLFNRRKSLKIDQDNHAIFSSCKAKLNAALIKSYKGKMFFLNEGWMYFGRFASIAVAIITFTQITHPGVGSQVVAIVCMVFGVVFLNILFSTIMPRYTKAGRAMRDAIDGYTIGLQNAGAAGLNLNDDESRERFNSYLPYALALGVQSGWSRQLDQVFAKGKHGESSSPGWYSPYYSNTSSLHDLTHGMSRTFSSSVSSASTSPSSSGGGSGGSSGGGGGGGGGGGW